MEKDEIVTERKETRPMCIVSYATCNCPIFAIRTPSVYFMVTYI